MGGACPTTFYRSPACYTDAARTDSGGNEPRMDATSTVGLPRALISRDSILHNVKIIRRALSPSTKICAMLKADAYGHGAKIVADTLTNFSFEGQEAPA